MRRLVALLCALPLLAMQAQDVAPWTQPTLALVPVTRFDSARDGVLSSDLGDVIVPVSFTETQRAAIRHANVISDADPIARVRRTGEVALVPAVLVTSGVRTLDLDGRFFWTDADRAAWPLAIPVDRADPLPRTWSVLAAGEMIFGRGVQERIETRFKGDASAAFVKVRDRLRAADLAIATLEAPLSGKANQWCDSCMRFVGNERYATGIADAGLDVVSLAANHIGDAGPSGVLDTMRSLDAAHVAHVGAGADAAAARTTLMTTAGGVRVALLAYDDVPPAGYGATRTSAGSNLLRHDDPTYAAVRMDVARASLDADVVIVLAHWGAEYEDAPRENVVAAAHAMVEAGATAIVGDHPHWVQSIERYRGAYIAYGVGNFVFDQMWSDETREGSLQELSFLGDRLVSVRILPTLIEDYYRPRLLRSDEPAYRAVLQRIWKHSIF
jgi:poly-gamma-glutamate capsule biosynthesis protein CapA/YwtB (metallophosphatase superfamily)